jgi:hypothetical protein
MTGNFEPDPDKYAELSMPFESEEEANKVASAFFNAVRAIREQYRIPELIIQFQLYVQTDEGVRALRGGGGWGDQHLQAELAKRAFDQEFEHLCVMVGSLAQAMPKVRKKLITDPSCEEEKREPREEATR